MPFLSKYLFIASWQYSQFSRLKASLPQGWMLKVADFAENFRTFYQDEIASAHWTYSQITVFPVVCFYRCMKCGESVQESCICLSEYLVHDSSAVKTFTKVINDHLQSRRHTESTHQVQFTDGCAAQFKSKQSFIDISNAEEDYGFKIERSFFGSRHGKGPADGLAAVVKQACTQAIKAKRAVITNANDMHEYVKESMTLDSPAKSGCAHKLQTFFLVQNIDRQPCSTDASGIVRTRKLHDVVVVARGMVKTRNLSCFCSACIDQLSGLECINTKYVDEWKQKSLLNENGKRKQTSEVGGNCDPRNMLKQEGKVVRSNRRRAAQ